MKSLFFAILLLIICPSSLKAQLKEFEISEMPDPNTPILSTNSEFLEDALIFVYSSIDYLSFRSSVSAIDSQYYNASANRYEILVKPIKQIIFISATEFMEQKLSAINPEPQKKIYFKVEEKKNIESNTIQGLLTINSTPLGASISLNGISITNKTPFTGELNPGPTRIRLTKSKFLTFDTVINVKSSINQVLTINLNPSTLWLNIKSNPASAQVELDGIILGKTPLIKVYDLIDKSKHGAQLLKISLPDYTEHSQTIQVYPTRNPLKVNVDLKKLEGTFTINSNPNGAEVFIDGIYSGITPLLGTLPIDTYSVEIKMEDYLPFHKKKFIVKAQTTSNFEVDFNFIKELEENCLKEHENARTVKDFSGNIYKTAKIGNQIWMAENLKTDHYANGDSIPKVQVDKEWIKLQSGAWCEYENTNVNYKINCKLYNWYAVSDSRNVCPNGWHVPTESEWDILIENFGGEDVAREDMKNIDPLFWQGSNYFNEEVGYRGIDGKFWHPLGSNGLWWSSTESESLDAVLYQFDYYYGEKIAGKMDGFSVRCIKD